MAIQPIRKSWSMCAVHHETIAFRHIHLAFRPPLAQTFLIAAHPGPHLFLPGLVYLILEEDGKMFRRAIAVLVCALAFATPALAQEQRGSLEGTIKDAQG